MKRRPLLEKKRALIALLLALAMFAALGKDVELDVRAHVVQLSGNGHSCTAIQVRTPKGEDVLVSASHCAVLADKSGSIMASLDGQRAIPRRVIEDSATSDLMLLEGMPHLRGIAVAHSLSKQDTLMAVTHGLGLPTHKAVGEMLGIQRILVLIGLALSKEEVDACRAVPKYSIVETMWGPACALDVEESVTTVHVDPGSSGGPVVNKAGELVGIVSAGNEQISLLVTLSDIQAFLAPY